MMEGDSGPIFSGRFVHKTRTEGSWRTQPLAKLYLPTEVEVNRFTSEVILAKEMGFGSLALDGSYSSLKIVCNLTGEFSGRGRILERRVRVEGVICSELILAVGKEANLPAPPFELGHEEDPFGYVSDVILHAITGSEASSELRDVEKYILEQLSGDAHGVSEEFPESEAWTPDEYKRLYSGPPHWL